MGRQYCGIDISDRTIEVVSMESRSQGPKVVMAVRAELPSGLVSRGVIQDPAALGAVLREYLDRIFGHRRHVVAGVSVPEMQVYSRTLEIPSDTEAGLVEDRVMDLASGLMPIDIDASEVTVRKLDFVGDQAKYFCAAVERKILEDYRLTMETAGVDVAFFETESSAISRAVVGTDKPVMIVDMGSRTTLVTVLGKTMRMSANPMIGGDTLTESLEQKLGVSYVKAEKMKRLEGLNPDKGDGRTMLIIQKPLSVLVEELGKTVKFFEEKTQESVEEIILVGGGSMVPGVVSYFQSNFRTKKVYQGQPFMGLVMGEFPNSVKVIGQHIFYATAVGLALRACGAAEDEHIDFNVEAVGSGGIISIINKLLQAVKLPTMPTKNTKSAGSKKTPKKSAAKSKSPAKSSTVKKRKPAKKAAKTKKAAKEKSVKAAVKEENINEEILSQAPPEVSEAIKAAEQAEGVNVSPNPSGFGIDSSDEEEEMNLPPVVPHELPAIEKEEEEKETPEEDDEEVEAVLEEDPADDTESSESKEGNPVAGERPVDLEDPEEDSSGESEKPVEASALGEEPALDDKDYGLGIGDILSQDDSGEIRPAQLNDSDTDQTEEELDEGVHRLKIEEILGQVEPSVGGDVAEDAEADVEDIRMGTRQPKKRNNRFLVVLVIILFIVAAGSIFMFVSKNGLWFSGDRGAQETAPGETADNTPAPQAIESVVSSLLLTTDAERVAEGREPVTSRVIETDVIGSYEFEATGQVEAPAQEGAGPVPATGTITVVNDSGRSFTFVATTRFLSEDGTLFRMKSRNAIPEGETEVEVYADVPGPDGNVAPTTFTIPGLSAETQKLVTGRSDSFMSGGNDGVEEGETVTGVSQEDLDAAREKLVAELTEEAKSNFAVMLAEGEMVHDDLISGSDLEVKAPEAGAIGDSFTYEITQRYRAFLIPENEVMELLDKELDKHVFEDGTVSGHSVGKPVYVVEAYDASAGMVELRVEAPVLSE